jgi:hypothetical protein
MCLFVLGLLSRYLREKDHFERQYKKHLSKRLLASKAPNEGESSRGGTCLAQQSHDGALLQQMQSPNTPSMCWGGTCLPQQTGAHAGCVLGDCVWSSNAPSCNCRYLAGHGVVLAGKHTAVSSAACLVMLWCAVCVLQIGSATCC